MIIGIDTGGTFTDFIYHNDASWAVLKTLSSPDNPAAAVITGLSHITEKTDIRVVHGSTVATNAVLEKKGARTALLTNTGFTDVIEIGRQQRERLYDLYYHRRPPLVPQNLRFGVCGRINADGEELTELDEATIKEIIRQLADLQVESVAVAYLFAFANPAHEQQTAAHLAELGCPVSLSHEILPEFREYERTSTTVINAYVAPRIRQYIDTMAARIPKGSFRIMQSNGGSISAETAAYEPVRTILSGPAGGVVGAYEIGKTSGFERLITFDMGGTSTDVALVDQNLPISVESTIDGFPIKVPLLDIHTVGAGGGSIARMDAAGAMKVGPESAAADPGPICYGRGEKITVTDANLFLGRLQPDFFLGGGMHLETEKLPAAFNQMAEQAGLTAVQVAKGVLSVANTAMERAIRNISVERGHDPAEFSMVAFGGAGGLHAAFLAGLLNIPRVIIPRHPGILSAIGILTADLIRDYSQTVMIDPAERPIAEIESLYQPMADQGQADLIREGVAEAGIRLEHYADMRYKGQSYEIMVPFDRRFIDRFHKTHKTIYGFSSPDYPVELVNIRIRAIGTPDEKPAFEKLSSGGESIPVKAILAARPVIFDQDRVETPIIDRDRLLSENRIPGPAIITEYSSTIVIPPFAEARVDEFGNIIINLLQ
jgi:N-methylhydantoinase A